MTDFNDHFAKLSPEDQLKVINDNVAFGMAAIRIDGNAAHHTDAKPVADALKRSEERRKAAEAALVALDAENGCP